MPVDLNAADFPDTRQAHTRFRVIFGLIFMACGVFVAASYQFEYRAFAEGWYTLPAPLQQLYLGHENNLAAWFSGALLALIGFHAMDGHSRHRQSAPALARAWAIVAGVMIFLSADEIGSLHERMAGLGKTIGIGAWGLLLPLGGVIAVLLIWAMATLWRAGGTERIQAVFLAIGFGFLGSVAVQEFLEHALTWDGARALALRVAIEEGSELLGTLILLGVTMGNSTRLLAEGGARQFDVLMARRGAILVALLAAAPLVIFYNIGLEDHKRGQPADWLAAIAFLAAAAVFLGAWLDGKAGFAALVMVGLLLALSCGAIAIAADGAVFETPLVDLSRKAVVLVTLAALALLTLAQDRSTVFSLTVLLGAAVYFWASLAREADPAPVDLARKRSVSP